jgi:O-antigen/teichoic acid export membrane protein
LKQSIASDAVKLTTSKFITLLISLVTAMLLSRFRTLEEYGTYSQIMLVISLTTTIFMLGLPNSINYFLARTEDPIERNRFLSVYYTFSTILSFIAGLVLVISAPLIVRYFDNALIKNFIYVLAIYPWARIIQSSIDNVLIVYKKTNHLMAFRIINSIFLLLIIIIVEAFNWGFAMYMALFIVVEAVFAVIVYILVKNIAGNIKIYFDKTLIRTIMNFSLPIGHKKSTLYECSYLI